MPTISGSSRVYVGAREAIRAYLGSKQVWPPLASGTPDPTNLWGSSQDVDSYVANNPTLRVIAEKPHVKWVGDWVSTSSVTATVAGYATAAAGKTMGLCLYAIPGRDNGGYSSGGFPDRASYLTWVQNYTNGLGSAPCLLVYEPDALGHLGSMSATARAERVETMRQALLKLAAKAPTTETFIDVGMWLDVSTAVDYLVQVGVATVAGFALNTSAFERQTDCYSKGDAIVAALTSRGITGKTYVVDSSRNGNGPLTSAFGASATPWLNAGQAWCNPPGRGLGLPPGPVPGRPACRATLWVKNPGGSDGNSPQMGGGVAGTFVSTYFGESAPVAGTYWPRWALDIVANTSGAA